MSEKNLFVAIQILAKMKIPMYAIKDLANLVQNALDANPIPTIPTIFRETIMVVTMDYLQVILGITQLTEVTPLSLAGAAAAQPVKQS